MLINVAIVMTIAICHAEICTELAEFGFDVVVAELSELELVGLEAVVTLVKRAGGVEEEGAGEGDKPVLVDAGRDVAISPMVGMLALGSIVQALAELAGHST